MNEYLQLAIAAAIVIAVFWTVHRHGRGNPENTGHLGRRLKDVEVTLQSCATRGSLDLLAEQVRNLESHAASSGEVIELGARINGIESTLVAKIDAVGKAADRTEAGVQRIEGYFLSKGINRK
ncbi:MAG: hypothetical protein ABIO86_17080 [Sphingomonas sp.]